NAARVRSFSLGRASGFGRELGALETDGCRTRGRAGKDRPFGDPGPGVRTKNRPMGRSSGLRLLANFWRLPAVPAVACAWKVWPNTAAALRRIHTGFPLSPRPLPRVAKPVRRRIAYQLTLRWLTLLSETSATHPISSKQAARLASCTFAS